VNEIERLIPHREPFVLLDRIVSVDDMRIVAEASPRSEDELFSRVFAGHYPGNPITPGVLLCEMVFQAGAALLSHRLGDDPKGTPVVVKISNTRFKQIIRPDDRLDVEALFVEQLSNAFYMKGSVKCGGKLAVRVEFTCALVPDGEA
jgi:3-hydroxyacyl-[acyl-carrier-protein] dehydratase